MSEVFVSYKAEDRRRVKPLVDALEADGFSVWWDEQIGGGAAWRHEIETQLNAARCVIVIWSKRSVGPEGTFVHDEAALLGARSLLREVSALLDELQPNSDEYRRLVRVGGLQMRRRRSEVRGG